MIIFKKQNNSLDSKISKIFENLNYVIVEDKYEDQLENINYYKYDDSVGHPLSLNHDLFNKSIDFGGENLSKDDFILIAGPCAAESEEQIHQSVEFHKNLGIKYFRAGCFKPRTQPYTFQGLGLEGLKLVKEKCVENDLIFVSEVRDYSNLDNVMEYADVVQVGSKCMYDTGVLKELGKTKKSVLLKRHFGATLKEFLQSADFILSLGNTNVALCERGIRSFETNTRFTLDSCGIEWLKEHSWMPIIGDPSHSMGSRYGIEGLSLSMVSQKINGLIIEVHPNPMSALSDSNQQLNFNDYENLYKKITKLNKFINTL